AGAVLAEVAGAEVVDGIGEVGLQLDRAGEERRGEAVPAHFHIDRGHIVEEIGAVEVLVEEFGEEPERALLVPLVICRLGLDDLLGQETSNEIGGPKPPYTTGRGINATGVSRGGPCCR